MLTCKLGFSKVACKLLWAVLECTPCTAICLVKQCILLEVSPVLPNIEGIVANGLSTVL